MPTTALPKPETYRLGLPAGTARSRSPVRMAVCRAISALRSAIRNFQDVRLRLCHDPRGTTSSGEST
jgi:hypothetical protein